MAQWVHRCIITALDTEALDISVISVFRIVAYALLACLPFPYSSPPLRPSLSLSFVHSLFVYRSRTKRGEVSIGRTRLRVKCASLACVIDNYAANEIKCRFDLHLVFTNFVHYTFSISLYIQTCISKLTRIVATVYFLPY